MVSDEELKLRYAEKNPYGEWLDSNLVELNDLKVPNQAAAYTYKRRASPLTEDLWLYLRAVPHHDPSNGIKRCRSCFSYGC